MRNPILVGERIYLRPLETDDAEIMARGSALEPDVMMDGMRIPLSPVTMEHWVRDLHERQPPATIFLAVCLIEDDRFIGSVGLMGIDYVNRTAETGSWIDDAEFRSRGYGTEAKMLLLEYAFDRLHLHALVSHVWELNTRSSAALAKQGYHPAGRLKWDELKDGVYHDILLFDVLRDEWLTARERWRQEYASVRPES
ncbi:MAG TPA: GNAT family protein [Thermomicrobiales bacterium]|nr:GNAT family protein [Thermomicrobiales bacterium]